MPRSFWQLFPSNLLDAIGALPNHSQEIKGEIQQSQQTIAGKRDHFHVFDEQFDQTRREENQTTCT